MYVFHSIYAVAIIIQLYCSVKDAYLIMLI